MLVTKCGVCGHELIECGEHDGDNENELIVNLSCPFCETQVIYYIDLNEINKIKNEH